MTYAPTLNSSARTREGSAARYGAVVAALGVFSTVALALATSFGGPSGPVNGLLAVAWTVAESGPALLFLAAALGLGRIARPMFREASDPTAIQAAVGLSLMLTLSHLLGVSGVMGTSLGRALAVGLCVIGLVMGAHQLAAASKARATRGASMLVSDLLGTSVWHAAALFAVIPAAAVLIAAACNPPGWLWASEFGGFDALSYHLQLPREWLASGRVKPLEHNVYSYLPGYVEAAYAFLGWMKGLGTGVTVDPGWVMSCQVFHAGTAIFAAWCTARATRAAILRSATPDSQARPRVQDRTRARFASAAGLCAGAIVLTTPWSVVVGSLAYNEMPMLALFAAALLVALGGPRGQADEQHGNTECELPVWRRGALAGWLVGIACGVKPTALLFVGGPVAVALLFTIAPRQWVRMIAAGTVAGMLALLPWLLRNYSACGNPVFPYAASVFGSAHWTGEQVERFAGGHRFVGTLLDRMRLLALPDASDPMGLRHRGMLHDQWGFFFPGVGVAMIAGVFARSRAALVCGVGLVVQILAWLLTTHLQSRFMLPMLISGAMLVGVVVGEARQKRWAICQRIELSGAVLLIALQSLVTVWLFVNERGGRPNYLLVGGSDFFTGEPLRATYDAMSVDQRKGELGNVSPVQWLNLTLPDDAVVYLLGDSTPLYFECKVVYHTTWDASPLGLAMRHAPGAHEAWTKELKARGITHVLYNPNEIDRLQRSGWYDPMVTLDVVSKWLRDAAEPVECRGGGCGGSEVWKFQAAAGDRR